MTSGDGERQTGSHEAERQVRDRRLTLGPVFARLLGGRFQRLLPPTLDALVALAERPRR